MLSRYMKSLRHWARTRNAFLVIALLFCLLGASTIVAIAQRGPGFVLNGTMMGPDNFEVPQGKGKAPIVYSLKRNRDGSYQANRNGAAWLTILHKNGSVEIRDPNSSSSVVIIKTTEKEH